MRATGARIALLVLVMLAGLAAHSAAQSEFVVKEVVVEGNRIASQSLILGVSSIDRGSPLTPQNSSETIRRLYGLGIFSDVRLEAEEVPGGVRVYIVVVELPKLAGLEFQGNDKINEKELRESLNLGVGGYISPYLIDTKKEEIKAAYAEKGYFRAEITPNLTYNSDSTEAVLSYRIEERDKVKVEHVVLTGAVRVDSTKAVNKMRNRKRGFLLSSSFVKDRYEEDLDKIIEYFHNEGHIDAYVVSDSFTIDTFTNRMTIFIDVYEGPTYYFGEVAFEGNAEMPQRALEKTVKYDPGDVFNAEDYDKTLEEIYSAYYDIGHLHTRILDERTTVDDTILNITYQITEGLPSHIRLIKIVGNHKTREKVIRREITSLPGDKFTRSALIRSVRDVMALNFFDNVVPAPIDLPSGDVDVEFEVKEKQTGQVSAGAGYNSQDKLVGNVGMGIPNFRGMGQSVSFDVNFGSRRNSFSVSFTEPWLFNRPTLLGVDLYTLNRRWYDDYTEARQGGSLRLGRRLSWPDNYFRLYTSYRLERAKYDDFDSTYVSSNSRTNRHLYNDGSTTTILREDVFEPYPGSILEYNEAWNAVSRISLSIVRDSRNLPEFATKGSKITYTFENTGGVIGGFWEYQKHTFEVAKFFPLFWKFAVAAKVQFAAITSPDDKRILLSDRFTPGGTAYDGIVRGYDDGTLTPDSIVTLADTAFYYDAPDTLTGNIIDTVVSGGGYVRVRGNYMLISNIEIQFPIVERQIYTLLFFDAGNSWLRWHDINPIRDLYTSVGAGFRILVPGIGTIGFDFGYALDEVRGQDKGWKPHFQIGTTFR